MSFSHKHRAPRRGITRDLSSQRTVRSRRTNDTRIRNQADRSNETRTRLSNLIEERIKANPEALHAQIAVTLMLDKLIRKPVREFLTATFREPRFPSRSPRTDGAGTSRTPLITPMKSAGYSPGTAYQ